jgi:hypothetical protein
MIRQSNLNTQNLAPTTTRIHTLPSSQSGRDSKITSRVQRLVTLEATQTKPSLDVSQIRSPLTPTQPLSSRETSLVRINQPTYDASAENILDNPSSNLVSGIRDNKEENNPHEVRININVIADSSVLARPFTPPFQRQYLIDEALDNAPPSVFESALIVGAGVAHFSPTDDLPTLLVSTGVGALVGGCTGLGMRLIINSVNNTQAQLDQTSQIITDLEASDS